MKNYKVILVAILCGITIFSVFKYVSALRQKHELSTTIEQIREQAASLEKERQNLLQTLEKEKQLQEQLNDKILTFKDYLKAGQARISKLFTDKNKNKKTIEELSFLISELKNENKTLEEEKARIYQENETLSAKLNSVAELKKAMQELRKQMRKVGIQILKKVDANQSSEGNRGFVVKDGKPTGSAKVKIEVMPAPLK
ncbi:MAG: hypothetical protein M0R66_06180 [Candidatus Omnitrophica bacterium]|nr:hypothetical protein [Candidatus Omnitrophota bacterium]